MEIYLYDGTKSNVKKSSNESVSQHQYNEQCRRKKKYIHFDRHGQTEQNARRSPPFIEQTSNGRVEEKHRQRVVEQPQQKY